MTVEAEPRRALDARVIEVLPIGARFVLRNRRTGATILSDAHGLAILEGLERSRAIDAIAEDLKAAFEDRSEARAAVEETLLQWSEAGLWGVSPVAFPDPPETASPAPCSAVFRLGERSLRLSCDDRWVFDDICALMSSYRASSTSATMPAIAVTHGARGHLVCEHGQPLWRHATSDEARFLVLQAAQRLLLGPGSVSVVLHAATVTREGRALLLAGASGRGKTSLALRLVREGWSFAGDDLVALSEDGGHILPLPFAANCKSQDDLGRLAGLWRKEARRARCGGLVWPEPRAAAGQPVPVAGLVLPSFEARQGFSKRARTPEETLVDLLTSGTEVLGRTGSVEPLTALLNGIPIEAWQFGKTDDAVRAACDLFSSRLR